MRLIDADEVKRFYEEDFPTVDNGVHWSRNDIIMNLSNIPTVKAIPIEWIRKMMDKYKDWEFDNFCESLIETWEKENEQKDNDRLILKAWKKTTLTKEELEKAFEDNEFNEYMQMLINKEFEKRLKQKVQGYESRDTESIK